MPRSKNLINMNEAVVRSDKDMHKMTYHEIVTIVLRSGEKKC